MSQEIGRRQYTRDLKLDPRAPYPVRDLAYDAETGRLSWTPPSRGPAYSHFLVRIDDDSIAPKYVMSKRTKELVLPYECNVIVSTWNEISNTESPKEYLECVPSSGVEATRRSYPWAPRFAQPDVDDPIFDETDWGFAVAQATKPGQDESAIVELIIQGYWIVNEFSDVAAPTVPALGTYAASGGTIPGENTYYIRVCAVDSDGLMSDHSTECKVVISVATDLNTITVPITQWDSGAVGYKLFAGQTPYRLTEQAAASSTPTSITITAYRVCDAGIVDSQFKRYKVNEKRIFHSGVFGATVTAVAANEIEIYGSGWTTNQWVGHVISIIGKDVDGFVEIRNFEVTGNTSDTLTVTPDPEALNVLPEDVSVMRSLPVVGSDATGNYIEDANWLNTLSNGGAGLTVNGEVGRIIRFIAGAGRGYEYRIKSNTASRIYIDGDWIETPDATSIFVVCEVLWQTLKTTEDLRNSEYGATLTMSTLIANEDRLPRLVQVLTLNADGLESLDWLSPVREIFIFGEESGPYEPCGFNMGMCADLAVDDVPDGLGQALTDGTMVVWGINAKTPSTSGRIVVDVERSRDGAVTWTSIFPTGNDNKLVLEANDTYARRVKTFDIDMADVLEGDQFRAKVLEAGTGARYVGIKGLWRKKAMPRGTLDFSFEGGSSVGWIYAATNV